MFYIENAFEATDFIGCSQTWCSAFKFVAGPLYIFSTKLQPNNMKNNMIFTHNSSGILGKRCEVESVKLLIGIQCIYTNIYRLFHKR